MLGFLVAEWYTTIHCTSHKAHDHAIGYHTASNWNVRCAVASKKYTQLATNLCPFFSQQLPTLKSNFHCQYTQLANIHCPRFCWLNHFNRDHVIFPHMAKSNGLIDLSMTRRHVMHHSALSVEEIRMPRHVWRVADGVWLWRLRPIPRQQFLLQTALQLVRVEVSFGVIVHQFDRGLGQVLPQVQLRASLVLDCPVDGHLLSLQQDMDSGLLVNIWRAPPCSDPEKYTQTKFNLMPFWKSEQST